MFLLIFGVGSVVIMLGPFIWMICSSLKTPAEIITFPPTLIPKQPTFENFVRIFTDTKIKFGLFFLNSVYISTVVTLTAMLTSAFVGYIFAKFKFWGQNVIFLVILSGLMVPFAIRMLPLYLFMVKLHLVDTRAALILPGLYSSYGIFLMRQFMHSIPNELRDAARIDGCLEFRIFWSIILPLSKPALAALAVFIFMWNWNDFVWPLIILQSMKKFTLPLGLAMFSNQWFTEYGPIMAGAAVSVIPILMVFLVVQRRFIEGINITGSKG